MKLWARVRARGAVLLVTGGSVSAFGGCLPENYIADMLVRLTTGAADVAVQALVELAIDTVLPSASGVSGDEAAG